MQIHTNIIKAICEYCKKIIDIEKLNEGETIMVGYMKENHP